eukprot:7804845-Lingulodinium_polyedra.AAC.1
MRPTVALVWRRLRGENVIRQGRREDAVREPTRPGDSGCGNAAGFQRLWQLRDPSIDHQRVSMIGPAGGVLFSSRRCK